jgi:protein ImuA
MSTHDLARLISRQNRRPRAALPFLGALSLARARVHEFCGPARRTLALMAARGVEGPVLWLRPGWLPERLFPEGVVSFIEPGRLIFVTPRRPEDLLWCFEEGLRGGATALVVAELPEPPRLTPVRRLQLAAETGAAEGRVVPTGLMLTPGQGGAPGVESRWSIVPDHGMGRTRWRLDLLRARADPPQSWTLAARANGVGFALARVKSPTPDHAEMSAAGQGQV